MEREAAAAAPESTTINIGNGSGGSGEQTSADHAAAKGKAAATAAPPLAPPPPVASKGRGLVAIKTMTGAARGGCGRGLAVLDFLVRLCAIGTTLAAAVAMGTADELLPFFTEEFQFRINFDNFPALTFFLVGNSVAGGYLLLSLPFSIISIVRPRLGCLRLLLLIFDTVMVALTSASAAAAAAIVYLAHTGDSYANWVAICMQFQQFCQQSSGAVISSFLAVLFFMVLVVLSALIIKKH